VVEDSRPSASEDVEAAEDAGPSTKSTEKKEKVRRLIPPTFRQVARLISRKQQ